MQDTYTETTSRNIFQRTGSALKGIFFGIILFIVSIILLWMNEGRSVKTAKAISELDGNYTVITPSEYQPELNGKLVYTTGSAKTDEVLSDSSFNISAKGIHLKRQVEMYQWEENESSETVTKVGGTEETRTTYTYSKGWFSSHNDSSAFKQPQGHNNPSMEHKSRKISAKKVALGTFTLNSSMISDIGQQQALPLSDELFAGLPNAIRDKAQRVSNEIYIGNNPNAPEIGDYKIRYMLTPSTATVSLLAVQDGMGFKPYQASNGRTLQYLHNGVIGPEDIIQGAKDRNKLLTWGLRGLGLVLMCIAFSLITGPLPVLASVIPPLGRLVGTGLGFICFLLSLIISTLVIALAWLFYRPLLGLALIGGAAALIYLLVRAYKKRSETQTPPVPIAVPAGSPSPPPPAP